MDDTLLQSVEQDVSAWLGTEEDAEGNNFRFDGRYDEEVMMIRTCVFYTQTRLCLYQPADFKREALVWVKFQARDRNAKVLKAPAPPSHTPALPGYPTQEIHLSLGKLVRP